MGDTRTISLPRAAAWALMAAGVLLQAWALVRYGSFMPLDGSGTEPCEPGCSEADIANARDAVVRWLVVAPVLLTGVGVLLDAALARRGGVPRRGPHPVVVLVVVTVCAAVLGFAALVLTLLMGPRANAGSLLLPLVAALALHLVTTTILARSTSPAAARWISLAAIALGLTALVLAWWRSYHAVGSPYEGIAAPLAVGLVAAGGSAWSRRRAVPRSAERRVAG